MSKLNRLLLICALCLLLTTSGCWSRRELDEVAIVSALGFDYSEDQPDQFVITNQLINPRAAKSAGGGNGGGGQEPFVTLTTAGPTVFEAGRRTLLNTTRALLLSHIQAFVISREAAERGMLPIVDFLVRDQRPREFKPIFVTEGKACDLLQAELLLADIPATALAEISQAQTNTGFVKDVPLHEFHERMRSKTSAPTAPLLYLEEREGKKFIRAGGQAVFSKGQMVGQLDELATRGLLWIEGITHRGVVVVPLEQGSISLQTIRVVSRLKPKLQDGLPSVAVEVEVVSDLGAQNTSQDLSRSEGLKMLSELLAEEIEQEMATCVQVAQGLNADILGFGAAFQRKFPKEKHLVDRWDQVFPSLQVEYKVRTNVRLRGLITTPPVPDLRPPKRGGQ